MSATAIESTRPSYVPAEAHRVADGWESVTPWATHHYPDPGTAPTARGGHVVMRSTLHI